MVELEQQKKSQMNEKKMPHKDFHSFNTQVRIISEIVYVENVFSYKQFQRHKIKFLLPRHKLNDQRKEISKYRSHVNLNFLHVEEIS